MSRATIANISKSQIPIKHNLLEKKGPFDFLSKSRAACLQIFTSSSTRNTGLIRLSKAYTDQLKKFSSQSSRKQFSNSLYATKSISEENQLIMRKLNEYEEFFKKK